MTRPGLKRVCLFAHYAPDRRLSASVLHYLGQIAGCGFAVHVALSGMQLLSPEDAGMLDALGVRAYPRGNGGLDFGAWQHLIGIGCAQGADAILLANDSVFGPTAELAPIVARMEAQPVDVWGMVESHEAAWHLQSWFLWFSAKAFAAPAIVRVLAQPFERMDKAEIVLHGEIGLGAAIRAEGLAWGACLPDRRRGLRRLVAVNPMHVDWACVLRGGLVPFLKVELLRCNPARIPWLGSWPRLLARHGAFPEAWIRERIGPARPDGKRATLRMRLVYVLLTRDRAAALRALFYPRY